MSKRNSDVGYWSINGVPSCRAPEARSCCKDLECAVTPEQFAEMAQMVQVYFPKAVIEHHIGEKCPIYQQEYEDWMDFITRTWDE